MSNRSLFFLLLLALAVFLVVKYDVMTDVKVGVTNLIYGDEMKGIKGFLVSVDSPNPELEKDGLRREEVLRELTAKIEKAGIKILSDEERQKTPGKPALNVKIQATKLEKQHYQYIIEMEVTKIEVGKSLDGSERIKTIWSEDELGRGDVFKIRTKINEITNVFFKARSNGWK
jgi:hypothetical protein